MPVNDEYTQLILDQQQNAVGAAMSSFDDNPDDAARARDIERHTGVPGIAYLRDKDRADDQHRQMLTHEILQNSPALIDYINTHPLNAKISNDDWGALSQANEALKRFAPYGVIQNFSKGFREGFAEKFGPLDQSVGEFLPQAPQDKEFIANHPVLAEGAAMVFATAGLLPKAFGAANEGLRQGLIETLTPSFGENFAKRLAREVAGMAEYEMMKSPDAGVHLLDAIHGSRFHLAAGEDVPARTHPVMDTIKAEEAKRDAENFDDVIKETQATATAKRSPEALIDFLRTNPEATQIHISAEAIRKLYGDEVPTVEDGKLGFVPDLAQQLRMAGDYGSDIVVPTPEYVAKVDPEIHKALRDDIRLREQGLTLNESKELPKINLEERPQGPLTDAARDEVQHAVDTVRYSAKMPGWDYADVDITRPPGAFPLEPSRPALFQEVKFTRGGGRPTGRMAEVTPVGQSSLKKALKSIRLSGLDYKLRTLDVDAIINSVIDAAGDIPVYVIADADMVKTGHVNAQGEIGVGGYYSPTMHHIVIPEKYFRSGKYTQETVFHEAVHAATERRLHQRPDLERQFREVMDEVLKAGGQDFAGKYQMINPSEFIAGALTNAKFQRELINIRISKELAQRLDIKQWREVTAFKAIVDFIRYLLRLPQQYSTALEAAVRLTEETMQTPLKHSVWKQIRDKAEAGQKFAEPPTEGAKPSDIMKPTAIGMTKEQFKKLDDLMAKQRERDRQAELERGKRFEEKKQTKEWRETEREIRDEVKTDLPSRPDIAVALLFNKGEWMGESLGHPPKIDPTYLSNADRIAVPPRFLGKGGMNPDDIAGAFGMQTGRELIDAILDWDARRGEMDHDVFLNKVIREEVAKRMEYRFGDLPENILEEAQTHVLSDSALDFLHEQTIASALHAGIGIDQLATRDGLPFTKSNVNAWVKRMFNESLMGRRTVKSYLKDAGKAGEMAEKLLKDDPAGALKAQQNQYYQAALAREALKFEKEQAQLARLVRKYNADRYPATVWPEATEWIQSILQRFGRLRPSTRTPLDLQSAISRRTYKTLESFWDHVGGTYSLNELADFLADDSFRKDLGELKVGEWREVHKAVKALDFVGRDVKTMDVEGYKQDLDKFVQKVGDKVKDKGVPDIPIRIDKRPSIVMQAIRDVVAGHITTESTLNRLDFGDQNGLLHKAVIYPISEAASRVGTKLREYQVELRQALGDKFTVKELDRKVGNDLWEDPARPGEYLQLSRRNVLGMLQNIGNPLQREKLFKGYGLEEAEGMDWIWRNVTREDLDRAIRIGNIWENLFDEASRMYEHTTGVPLEKIEVGSVDTPWGVVRGWYHPLSYDSRFPNQPPRALTGLNDLGFLRPTVPNAYTKRRTGYIAPVELDLDIVPARMKQMIYDTAMRPAVIQISKLFHDPEFKRIVTNAVGHARFEELRPWLKDVANMANHDGEAGFWGSRALEMLRQNTISVLIGMNPATVVKHGTTAWFNSMNQVGARNYHNALFSLLHASPDITKNNWQMAMDKSEFLRARIRNWSELILGHQDLSLSGNTLREKMIAFGSTPVAMGDLLSAVPTWLAQYKKALAEGFDEGRAVNEADLAVRNAHGSSIITNRPRLMRSKNPLGHWWASLYGFFSHMFQKQYEIMWRSKDLINKARGEGPLGAISQENLGEVGRISNMIVSYVLIPAIVEELVTPYATGDQHGLLAKSAYALTLGMSGSWLGLRDFVRGVINMREPQEGIVGPALKAPYELATKVLQGKAFSPREFGRTLSDLNDTAGLATGLSYHQFGRTGEFLWRYGHGLEHPDGLGFLHALGFERERAGWLTGLRRGTLKPPQRRRL